MAMTMTQKILAKHAGLDHVEAGQLIEAKLDVVMANDITGPMALPIFDKMADKVFDKDKVVLVPDHFTPNKDIKSAENSKAILDFTNKQCLTHRMEQGKCGVEHAILPEKGIVVAGECIIGADSHTCTYGALGAFSTGVGTTDIATGMATGEAGAKNGIFPVDDQTIAYIEKHSKKPYEVFEADEDAEYEQVLEINLSEVRPTVAFPHLPGNGHTIDEIEEMDKIYIDQVVIGSCTNGRLSDLEKAAAILKGKKVADNVRVMVVPATQKIFLQCIQKGLAEIFVEAGCAFNTPSCGPCMGGHMGVMAKGEKCVSTTNRNFVGRMGDTEALIYLASPQVAAASAIAGYIANPEKVGKE